MNAQTQVTILQYFKNPPAIAKWQSRAEAVALHPAMQAIREQVAIIERTEDAANFLARMVLEAESAAYGKAQRATLTVESKAIAEMVKSGAYQSAGADARVRLLAEVITALHTAPDQVPGTADGNSADQARERARKRH